MRIAATIFARGSGRAERRSLLRASTATPVQFQQLQLQLQRRSFVSLLNVVPRARPTVPREQQAPPLSPLPVPQLLHLPRDNCILEYVDLPPIESDRCNDSECPRATVVMLHGAPGTYRDFRHLIPMLQRLEGVSVRVVAVNLPGSSGSVADEQRYFEQLSALPAARLTLQALQALCAPDESVFLLGHSFGAHAAFNIAALNQDDAQNSSDGNDCSQALSVKGLVLLAPAGCRPHRVLRPKQNAIVVDLLRSSNALVARLMPLAAKFLYTKMLGFSGDFPASHYVAGIVRAGTTDFQVVADHVHATKKSTPAFLAWSTSDEYMEKAIPEELAEVCHPFGPRIAFAGGGHNIQKTRAEVLAREVGLWLREVLLHDDDNPASTDRETRDAKYTGILEQA